MIKKTLEIELTTKDDELADRISRIMNKNLFNTDFGVNKFCKEMNKSRTQLYRIIKRTTGKGVSEFIKYQRIKMACKLLEEENIDIKQVSESVGYKDSSYFTKIFKSVMNTNPSKYRKTKQLEY